MQPLTTTLDNTTAVETPERVRFEYHIAGPSRRAVAWLLDAVLMAVLMGFVVIVVSLLTAAGSTAANPETALVGVGQGLSSVLIFAIQWGYFVYFETFKQGQTPGKRWLKLRVVNQGGYPIAFVDSLVRNLLRFADFLPFFYVTGFLTMIVDGRFRRLGDLAAGTLVVIEEQAQLSELPALNPPPSDQELRQYPSRPFFTDGERRALELFVRRTRLSAARQQELAQIVMPAFADRFGVRQVPEDAPRFLKVLFHLANIQHRRTATVSAAAKSPKASRE